MYFLDGHKSHMSLELSDFCVKHKIILYCLYPNSTHIIQPSDVAIFKPLKTKWRKVVQDYKQKTQKSISRMTFAPLFKEAFDQIDENWIKNGFRACGLYPFDENAPDYTKCISTRRIELNPEPVEAEVSSSSRLDPQLTQNDLVSTAKFLRHFLGEEKVREFSHLKSISELCRDPNYPIWEACMNGIECISTRNNSSPDKELQPPSSPQSRLDLSDETDGDTPLGVGELGPHPNPQRSTGPTDRADGGTTLLSGKSPCSSSRNVSPLGEESGGENQRDDPLSPIPHSCSKSSHQAIDDTVEIGGDSSLTCLENDQHVLTTSSPLKC
ncbi:uncharacterized protein LOC107044421 [Diachasma alloeum]|uniref:uncharacterized protein LOC107044421 n=1 Tax=Diachasma alloeum TaxID=454923 RepID=UPI00073837FF|nr:uncharacterized protein LOC107044421 [Diachasma alloeum]